MDDLLLMCRIADRQAAIPAHLVRSVIELEEITPIPGTPPHIAGLTALRSQALTVIDTRVALDFDPMEDMIGRRAAVVEHEGHPYALVLDEAYDVGTPLTEPCEVPGGFGAGWCRAATGMVETGEGPTLTLALDRLIDPSIDTLGQAAA